MLNKGQNVLIYFCDRLYMPKGVMALEDIKDEVYEKIPIILTEDFNLDISKSKKEEFLLHTQENFDLKIKTDTSLPPTKEEACIVRFIP